MLRVILKHVSCHIPGDISEFYYTYDIDDSELERILMRGGFDIERGTFERNEVVGIEVISSPTDGQTKL